MKRRPAALSAAAKVFRWALHSPSKGAPKSPWLASLPEDAARAGRTVEALDAYGMAIARAGSQADARFLSRKRDRARSP